MDKTTINIKITHELKKKAAEKAKSEGESLSVVIRNFLREYTKTQ